MEYLKINGEFPRLAPCGVTLGKFDGIHRGHMRLVEKVLEYKNMTGSKAVLFAIDVNEKMILSRKERADFLEKAGIDVLVECPLTDSFKHQKAENFIKEILLGDLRAGFVAVGEDYRFGYGRKGTPQLLKSFGAKYGFHAEVISKEMDGRRKVSSTFIREELKKGKMEKVEDLLGRPYFLAGEILHGRGLGHRMLLPTTNMIPDPDKLMPPNGVYVTVSHFENQVYGGITNIGCKPTVGGESFIGVETYLFDCSQDLYGKPCKVEFLHYLRPEHKFPSLEALKTQLLKDAQQGKDFMDKNQNIIYS